VVHLQAVVPAALAQVLRQGPMSQGKLECAWRLAVGEGIARVTKVSLQPEGAVQVEPTDQRWLQEIRRSSRFILNRLQTLLGAGAITRLVFVGEPARVHDPSYKSSHA
jgi:predicted nucleic acid-binding Zn ribbon protein